MNSSNKEVIKPSVDDNKCFFCQSQLCNISNSINFDGKKYDCDICGAYSVTRHVLVNEARNSPDFYYKLAAVAAELKLKGQDKYLVGESSNVIENVFDCQTLLEKYPKDFIQRLDRTLWNIAMRTNFSPINCCNFIKRDFFYTFSRNFEEGVQVLNFLKQRGDIDFEKIDNSVLNVHLTITGYERIRKIQLGQINGSYAFVAMWFEKDSNRMEIFRQSVCDAIRLAGYECKIVDTHEHNNFIMDEVINLINNAKFVVADFTSSPEEINKNGEVDKGVRGGVYFEAGYAKGKGKELICTCYEDEDSQKRRHFDIMQINTIFWCRENKKELVKRLYHRIIQSEKIGPGPLVVSESLKECYFDLINQRK